MSMCCNDANVNKNHEFIHPEMPSRKLTQKQTNKSSNNQNYDPNDKEN